MKFQIKHRYTDATLFEADLPDDMESGLQMRAALEQAPVADAYLRGAYLRSASRSDLLGILNDQLTVEEGLSLWGAPSVDVEKTKKRIIYGLAWDVAKARAEIEAHLE